MSYGNRELSYQKTQTKQPLKVLKRVKSSSYRSQTPRIKQKEGQLK